ncbi:asparagine synthase (glutamine-hydrolyzing) [Gammaproteobacteria bacterium]|nr:asparagine synthase (glutamine-hydrolyzing) [Gammaproteobacteria bacterium]
MCGISGFQYSDQSIIDLKERENRLKSTIVAQKNRGPDSNGSFISDCNSTFLGHTRLAIQDLDPRANQPFFSSDQRYCIVFNGEIYNFLELKKSFLPNHNFRTSSDTEVLLELFILLGSDCLKHLRGMFAFCVWDKQTQELFLARDPYGIKPLYYFQQNNEFAFASQVSALIKGREELKKIEPAGLVGFYLLGSVPEPWTLYQEIFSLDKGSSIRVKNGAIIEKVQWHDFLSSWTNHEALNNSEDNAYHAVQESIRSHLISDVPVCIFLSGGIDSSVLTSLAAHYNSDVSGINIRFKEFAGTNDDEFQLARLTADSLGIDLHTKTVSKEEFQEDFHMILGSMDQPSIDGINTWYASKAARENGYKVALSGIGGDEIFCGYSSFHQLPRILRAKSILPNTTLVNTILDHSLSLASKALKKTKINFLNNYTDSLSRLYFFKRSNFLPHEILSFLDAEIFEEGMAKLENTLPIHPNNKLDELDSLEQLSYLESNFYLCNQLLKDSDWASMHHSLELRTPLVDSILLKSIAPFISSMHKYPNKKLLSSSVFQPLPSAILKKSKTGFSIPLHHWIDDSLDQHNWTHHNQNHLKQLPWSKKWALALMENKFS